MKAGVYMRPDGAFKFTVGTGGLLVKLIPNRGEYIVEIEGVSEVFYEDGLAALVAADVDIWQEREMHITIDTVGHPTTFRATLAGVNYDYVSDVADTTSLVATGLGAAIDALLYVVVVVANVVKIFEIADGIFIGAASIVSGTGTLTKTSPVQGSDAIIRQVLGAKQISVRKQAGSKDKLNTHMAFITETGTATVYMENVEFQRGFNARSIFTSA